MSALSLLFRKRRTCIIIKDHVIRFVETYSPDLNSIKKYGERYLPQGIIREGKIYDEDSFHLILDECVNDWNIKRRKILFTVPDSSVVIRNVEVPVQLREDEIHGHLQFMVGETIHLPFDDPVFDYSVSKETKEKKEVVLIASPKAVVRKYEQMFKEVKLSPEVADLTSLSSYRLFYQLNMVNEHDHVLVVQYNIDALNITIFNQHQPVFTRHIYLHDDEQSFEIRMDDSTGEQFLWTEDDNAIHNQMQDNMTEIERIMNFYRFSVNQGKEGVSKVILTGDHIYIDDVYDKLKDSITVPVEMVDETVFSTKQGETIPARFYEAVGLSLKKEVP